MTIGLLSRATRHLLVVSHLLFFITGLRPFGDLGLGHRHHRQPVFAAAYFLGQIHAVRNDGLVRLLCQREQFLHFSLQLPLLLFDMSVGQGLMFGGVRVNLGAIQTYPADLQQFHFLGQFQHLHEQVL